MKVRKRSKEVIYILLLFIITGFFYSCPKRKPKPLPPQPQESEIPTTVVEEPSIRGEEFVSIPELRTVNFQFDRFDLTDEAKKILEENAKYLSVHPEYEILVEGHCCECGTAEYNLALGQKRAMTVREYYINLGIPAGKIATISYGEEKPINKNAGPPDSIRCIPNRRAETKVRIKK